MMSRQDNYHITKRPDGKWQSKSEGATRASIVTDTQAEAENRTRQMLRNRGNGEMYIHRPDGRIRDRSTYGRDPFPPRG